jgi:hypothetical protein
MTTGLTPTEIAEALNISRPDLEVDYRSTGGNVMCITAEITDALGQPMEASITIGTAGDYLGWSDWTGGRFGGWPGLIDNTEEDHAWYNDEPLEDGAIILARIAVMLLEELPPSEPITKAVLETQ